MRPIPQKLKDEMEADPFYQKCAWHGRPHPGKKIEWHHNLIFSGRQVNRKFAILPLCEEIHQQVSKREIREYLDWIMVSRATEKELEEFGLTKKFNRLKKKYENQKHHPVLHDNKERNLATIP